MKYESKKKLFSIQLKDSAKHEESFHTNCNIDSIQSETTSNYKSFKLELCIFDCERDFPLRPPLIPETNTRKRLREKSRRTRNSRDCTRRDSFDNQIRTPIRNNKNNKSAGKEKDGMWNLLSASVESSACSSLVVEILCQKAKFFSCSLCLK